ncbi:MAG TPA: DUF2304 domain-containing protein [bacterium]|nr:DUF2304 domain-containing protein [bacterium]
MTLLQYVLIVLSLLGLLNLFWQIRRGNLEWLASIKWFIAWIALLVVAIEPGVADWLANLFGTGRGADLLIYGAIVFIFLLIFKLILKLNQMDRQISQLVSYIAKHNVYLKDDSEKSDSTSQNNTVL